MSERTRFVLAATLCTVLTSTALAHHAVTTHFDTSKSIEIRGTVVDFKLRSPHASMVIDGISYVDGIAQESEPQRWEIESQAAAGLRAMGIERDTFRSGDRITVIAAPNRQPGFRFVNSSNFTDASGRQYAMASARRPELVSATRNLDASDPAAMNGIYQIGVQRPQNHEPLPLSEAGQAARDSYDPRESPANTCEPMSFPDMFYAPYLFRISVASNAITIYNQPWEVDRTVPLDGTAVSSSHEGLFGTITGRRDGAAVVLQSTGFPASGWGIGSAVQPLGRGADIPSSDQKTLTERFSLSEDGLSLVYEYTLTDPVYLSRPYQARMTFPRVADNTEIFAYECEEESASMFSRNSQDQSLQIGNQGQADQQ